MCGCLLYAQYWEPGLQPRHVPPLGTKLETPWFTAHVQSTELHQPGLYDLALKANCMTEITLLSVSMSSFFFSQSFCTSAHIPLELSVCSLSMSLSLFCLLVQFVH